MGPEQEKWNERVAGGTCQAVDAIPVAFGLLHEMRQQNNELEDTIDRLGVVWARVNGGGGTHTNLEKPREEPSTDSRSGLAGEMQDILDHRGVLNQRLFSLVSSLNGVV